MGSLNFDKMLVFDADDGGAGGGAGDSNAGGNSGGGSQGGSGQDNGNGAGAGQGKTYTQAELDRMFSERASRAEEATTKRILEALGVEDLDNAKTALAKVKELEDAQKSELEKLQEKIVSLEKASGQHATQTKALVTEYEVKLEAGKLGIVDPEAAFKLLDLNGLKFDKDGRPKNTEDLLKALLEERPYLAGKSRQVRGNAGSGTDQTPAGNVSMNDLIRQKAGRG